MEQRYSSCDSVFLICLSKLPVFFGSIFLSLPGKSFYLFISSFPAPDPRLFYAILGSSLLRRPEVVTWKTLEQLSD